MFSSTSALAVYWRWGGKGPLHSPTMLGLSVEGKELVLSQREL